MPTGWEALGIRRIARNKDGRVRCKETISSRSTWMPWEENVRSNPYLLYEDRRGITKSKMRNIRRVSGRIDIRSGAIEQAGYSFSRAKSSRKLSIYAAVSKLVYNNFSAPKSSEEFVSIGLELRTIPFKT